MVTAEPLSKIVGQLRQAAEASHLSEVRDPDLLNRFQKHKDAAAFEALVRRHGALVLSACRRVLADAADVDDVFQATFLVLLRRSNSIRKQHSIGSWLYGVAHRLAVQARDCAARRRRLERRAGKSEEVASPDLSWREACAVLHRELDRLPEKYRLPLLLCYLEGQSRDEAARRLGWTMNVIRGRLERGRQLLRTRLARSGVTLSAGLVAALGDSATADGLSPRLVQVTVNIAMTGRYSPTVAALLRGVSAMLLPQRVKLAAGFAIAVSMLAGAVAVHPASIANATPVGPTADCVSDDPKPRDRDAPDEQGQVIVSGRVLDSDRVAVVGARVSSTASGKNEGISSSGTTTGDDGRFRLALSRADLRETVAVVAAANGRAPDWVRLNNADEKIELILRKDDGAQFNGRITSLENQPLRGITVEVMRLGKVGEGDLTAWIEKNVEMRKQNYWLNEIGLIVAPGEPALREAKVATDADGSFSLSGFGRDRVLAVKVYGPSVETKVFWVVTRPGGQEDSYIKTPNYNHGVYPPNVRVLLAPSKPLVGTVSDSKTGKPVAGVVVSEVYSNLIANCVTDEHGRYRIEGAPKMPQYGLAVSGRKGLPYFDHSRLKVTDTAGLDALETNLTIDRGLELTGRVVDKAGQPVQAEIDYAPLDSNRNADPKKRGLRTSNGWKTKPDGTFYLTVWPGKGVIEVRGREGDRYATVDAKKILTELGVRSRPIVAVNAILPIDADPAKLSSLIVAITLEEASFRKGSIVGPDGKPLAGVTVAGLRPGSLPCAMPSSEFILPQFSATSRRLLLFLHDEKKLGFLQAVAGSDTEPVTAKLQPLGSVSGEVRTRGKKPWGGLTVTAQPRIIDADKYDNVPIEVLNHQGFVDMQPAPWLKLTKRTSTTGADGRFHIDGLFPGLEYSIYISDGDLEKRNTLVTSRQRVVILSGKIRDLGTLRERDDQK